MKKIKEWIKYNLIPLKDNQSALYIDRKWYNPLRYILGKKKIIYISMFEIK